MGGPKNPKFGIQNLKKLSDLIKKIKALLAKLATTITVEQIDLSSSTDSMLKAIFLWNTHHIYMSW